MLNRIKALEEDMGINDSYHGDEREMEKAGFDSLYEPPLKCQKVNKCLLVLNFSLSLPYHES